MDVEMPDGTIITDVPEGTTKGDLLRKLQKLDGSPEPGGVVPIPEPFMPAGSFEGPQDPGFVAPFARAGAEQFTENMVNIPRALINPLVDALTPRPIPENPTAADFIKAPLQAPVTAVSEGVRALTGGAIDPTAAAERIRAGGGPVPRVDATDVFAGVQTARSSGPRPLEERFREFQDIQEAGSQSFAEQAPVATTLGNLAGDVATIAAGRNVLGAAGVPGDLGKIVPAVRSTARTVIAKAAQTLARNTLRTGARATQTGLETAFLGAIQDSPERPADIDAIFAGGAGAQVAGDLALSIFKRNTGGASKVGSLLLLTTMGSLAFQQFTPGGLDRILPTIEARNKEIAFGVLLGGGVGLLSGGRVPKGFGGPAFQQIVESTRRGVLFNLLQSMARDPVRVAPVVQKLSEDPGFFGKKAERLLTRAITSEKIDVRNTIERLMKDREFRRRFESLRAPPQQQ